MSTKARIRVGADLTCVTDVAASVARFGDRYLRRIYTEHELATCSGEPAVRAARLAARFAAKEAVMKALGVGLWTFKLRDVEVARHQSGAPELVLRGKATDLAERRGVTGWHLSLTHTDSMAMAVAIALG